MKKQLMFGMISLALLGGANHAQAVVIQQWEHPIVEAEMEIVNASGAFSEARSVILTMTKRDGSTQSTGFVLFIDGQNHFLSVKKVTHDECGATVYMARETDLAETVGISQPKLSLQVLDQSTSRCEGKIGFQWSAHLKSIDQTEVSSPGTMEMMGSPDPVYTIQEGTAL